MRNILLTIATLFFSIQCWADNPIVRIETSRGNIDIELNAAQAPKTVENFLTYVNEGYYDNTIFHRVIKQFMIQGGGFTPEYKQKETHAAIQNEADNGLKNNRGTIAMARTNMPHSATAQFFINTKDNDFLNFTAKTMRGWGYTVFGKVIKGMDTVDKIERLKTSAAGPFSRDVPILQAIIKNIHIIKK